MSFWHAFFRNAVLLLIFIYLLQTLYGTDLTAFLLLVFCEIHFPELLEHGVVVTL